MIPSDIILSIFTFLSRNDIINCSRVSQLFHEISSNNKLWYYLIKKDYHVTLNNYYCDFNYYNNYTYRDIYKLITRSFRMHVSVNELNSVCNIEKFDASIMSDLSKYCFQEFSRLISLNINIVLQRHPINIFCLTNMKNLKYLYMNCNNLHDLPSIICSLITLEELDISYNLLADLPKSFSCLQSLRVLKMNNNCFTSIPKCIHNLPALADINVMINNLQTYPSNLNVKHILF